jgi:hypothetical protein
MEMNAFCPEASNAITDMTVKLTKDGSTNVGDDKRYYPTSWVTSSSNIYTYGTSSDLWGTTLTATEVNTSTFGVRVRVTSNLGSPGTLRTANIDYIRITIHGTW